MTLKDNGSVFLVNITKKCYKIIGVIEKGIYLNLINPGESYNKKVVRSAYDVDIREATEEDIEKAALNAL